MSFSYIIGVPRSHPPLPHKSPNPARIRPVELSCLKSMALLILQGMIFKTLMALFILRRHYFQNPIIEGALLGFIYIIINDVDMLLLLLLSIMKTNIKSPQLLLQDNIL